MASCSQVSSLLQAHIDGELGHAEKSILEQHLRECAHCQEELAEQNACSALIFESLATQRLQWGLRSRVLAHLPEMDPAIRLGSHPTDPQYARRRQRSAPFPKAIVAAAASIALLAGAYFFTRQEAPVPLQAPVGMVTYADGEEVYRKSPQDRDFQTAALKSLVRPEDEFATLQTGRLAISLIAESIIKANYNSGLTVHDNRNILLDDGLTYFDVGPDRRLFNVKTPNGNILVFGTAFVVEVNPTDTTVTVTKGDILVSNDMGKTGVSAGNQLVFRNGEPLAKPYPVNAAEIAAWADEIVLDADALALFNQTLERSKTSQSAIPAVPVHYVPDLAGTEVKEIQLEWTPDGKTSGHCGYIIHVTDLNKNLLYINTIDGKVFDDVDRAQLKLPLPRGQVTGVEGVHIKLVPDYSLGNVESGIEVKVFALPIPKPAVETDPAASEPRP